jgi:hypothetical protein
MTAKASIDVGAVIAAYDFTRFGRIAGIGADVATCCGPSSKRRLAPKAFCSTCP